MAAKPVRRAAAATRRAIVAPSASIRTGRSTTMSVVRPSRRSSSSKPASSRAASQVQRPLLLLALPVLRAAELGVRLPLRLLLPLAPLPPAPRPPLPWMAHRAKRLRQKMEANASRGFTASPQPHKQHDCLHCLAKILS